MVKYPSEIEVEELKNFKEPESLTIYLPHVDAISTGSDNPNRIVLKNLLKDASQALEHQNVKTSIIQATLKPAYALVESREFWPGGQNSLALFLHPKFFRYYHLPARGVPTVVSIRKGFNLVPLKEVMDENKTFYVLALSHNEVKLFEGTQFELKPVHSADLPTNMEQDLRIDEFEAETRFRTVIQAGGNRGAESFHGHYNKRSVDKMLLQKFFRHIDQRLHGYLKNKKVPLILAGVDYLLPIYKQINTYPHLLKDHITGNLENTNINWTREKAWSIVR